MLKNNNFLLLLIVITLLIANSSSQVCSQSQYFNGQRCAPCKANCKCTSDNTCDNCLSGYAFDATFSNCLQCPQMSTPANIGCKQCCSQISGTSFVCSQCSTDKYVFMKGGQCIKIDGCLSILDNGVCTSCAESYYLYEGKCINCDSSCKTCKDSTLCLSCKQNYFNTTNLSFSLCTMCNPGCKTCFSAIVCTTCTDAYYLSGSSCLACTANCLTCTGAGCTKCDSQSALISGSCFVCTDVTKSGTAGCQTCTNVANLISCTKCADSYYLNNAGQCVLCSTTFPNSILCTSAGPVQCLTDYHATLTTRNHLVSNQCVPNAKSCKRMANALGDCSECYFQSPDSYYKLSSNQCVKCVQVGCKSYSTSCQCLQCQQGYRYVNNLCVACQNLHCIKCQIDVQSCQKCAINYGIYSSACVFCTKLNCLNCDGDYSQCKTCQDGYYLNSGSCYLCQTNCLLCESNTKCTICAAGYYLQSNGRCKMKPTNCLQVDSKYLSENVAVCKKCQYGYQVYLGNCYPCSQTLFNLNSCQKYCPSYYALHSFQKYLLRGLSLLILTFISIAFL